MKTYAQYTREKQAAYNSMPYIRYAFGDYQTQAVFNSWGLTYPDDLDKVTTLWGCGDIIQKKDIAAFRKWNEEILKPFDAEFDELIQNDDFVIDMFIYEMGNHEYQYSEDDIEIIHACGLSLKYFEQHPHYLDLFKIAKRKFYQLCNENNWY